MSMVINSIITIGYIGPGAGFAFLGSFLVMLAAFLLVLGSILSFPIRLVKGLITGRRRRAMASAKRVVLIGMDGLDPERVIRLMGEGKLPHFAELEKRGMFSKMNTTTPPISPVAWSSFMTGTNPGKHNIFDFLNRDLRTYIPEMSSCRVRAGGNSGRRKRTAEVTLLRKSKPFWEVLGRNGIFSTVLRVPITFPPERFNGLCLSAMCTPDLLGSQGTFTLYDSTQASGAGPGPTGGKVIPVVMNGRKVKTDLPGPTVGATQLKAPLVVKISQEGATLLEIGGQRIELSKGEYSDWVTVPFKLGLKRMTGICRFLLLSTEPEFRLYVTPINIDPDKPVMPISHPGFYAVYLSKLQGSYATLGLAEDTWALNEGVIDDTAFLKQTYDIQREREEMFFSALKRTRTGFCCCVFDLPDRIQHMFYRYLDDSHPARGPLDNDEHAGAVDDAYRRMDDIVGRTMDMIDDKTVLIVISDHGFRSFRRGVNLNAWLKNEGYLTLKPGESGGEYLAGVDWQRTKAYSFGLAGIYLNVKGRESNGIVAGNGERQVLKDEMTAKLRELRDAGRSEVVIHAVRDGAAVYSGPYSDNGPDLVVGFADGYRASWENAVGQTDGDVFSDNVKCWSGDHCVDTDLVPGIFFSNWSAGSAEGIHITDMAPTVLGLFGIDKPGYMDGKNLKLGAK